MDAPPLDLMEFQYPDGRPDNIPHNGGVAFEVQVEARMEAPQPGSGILYVDTGDGNGFLPYPMPEISPSVYQAVFPSLACGTAVRYYVSADTVGGSTLFDPADAPDSAWTAIAADFLDTVFYDDGESNAGWAVSGNASDGQWDRGVPVGGGDRGDPATDGDGSGACWLTDNVDGNSDVDGGTTILTSPLLDATHGPSETPLLRYFRFYSNSFGNAPQSDEFVVEISNDGGASWVNLEIVGPDGVEATGGWYHKTFRIGDFLAPTGNMRVRFLASDLAAGSVVEAGVDGLEIILARCDSSVTPQGRKLLDGVVTGGALADVFSSDDADYRLDPTETVNPAKQKVDVIFLSETDVNAPSALAFRVEAAMTGGPSGDVVQTINLWNVASAQWDLVDSRAAGNTDSVVLGSAAGNLADYVHPLTGEILSRVTWSSPLFSAGSFWWSIDVDEAVWLIE
jgi:hypothetical protein